MPTTYTYTVKITVPDNVNLAAENGLDSTKLYNQLLAEEIQSGLEWLGVEVQVEQN